MVRGYCWTSPNRRCLDKSAILSSVCSQSCGTQQMRAIHNSTRHEMKQKKNKQKNKTNERSTFDFFGESPSPPIFFNGISSSLKCNKVKEKLDT